MKKYELISKAIFTLTIILVMMLLVTASLSTWINFWL